jgi:hypothetical protein
LYEGIDSCKFGHFSKFVNPDLKFCGGPKENTTATLLMQSFQVNMYVWACCPARQAASARVRLLRAHGHGVDSSRSCLAVQLLRARVPHLPGPGPGDAVIRDRQEL